MDERNTESPAEPRDVGTVQQIDPATMIFDFQLNANSCHEKRTGTCSLDKPLEGDEPQDGKASVHYCQDLHAQIDQHGFLVPVSIIKCCCGHYEFNDGQHRVCIAKKKGLEVPAVVHSKEHRPCGFCQPKWQRQATDLR